MIYGQIQSSKGLVSQCDHRLWSHIRTPNLGVKIVASEVNLKTKFEIYKTGGSLGTKERLIQVIA